MTQQPDTMETLLEIFEASFLEQNKPQGRIPAALWYINDCLLCVSVILCVSVNHFPTFFNYINFIFNYIN